MADPKSLHVSSIPNFLHLGSVVLLPPSLRRKKITYSKCYRTENSEGTQRHSATFPFHQFHQPSTETAVDIDCWAYVDGAVGAAVLESIFTADLTCLADAAVLATPVSTEADSIILISKSMIESGDPRGQAPAG